MAYVMNTALGGGKTTQSGTKVGSVYDNYSKAKSLAKQVAVKTNNSVNDIRQRASTISGRNNTGGGGTTVVSGGGGIGGGASWQDILSQIMEYAKQQKTALDANAKNVYDQAMLSNKQAYESEKNNANKQYMMVDRQIRDMYGNAMSGSGFSNRARNSQNWLTNLANSRMARSTNDANALNTYNTSLANNANMYQQAWLNSVLPTYANRQTLLDNLAYRNM